MTLQFFTFFMLVFTISFVSITNPAIYNPYVALTQNNPGNLYSDKNDYGAVLNDFQNALDVFESESF